MIKNERFEKVYLQGTEKSWKSGGIKKQAKAMYFVQMVMPEE